MTSISFDRAADIYDATRTLPVPVERAYTDALAAELAAAGADRVLEIGVGTGRIARPLAKLGVRACGIDIAPRMLARLRAQLGPQHVAPDLALGDATALPIRDASFQGVLAFHVLHLVSDWHRATGELHRVLAPGGVFLQDFVRWLGENPWDASVARWDELEARRGFARRSRPGHEQVGDTFRSLGGSCRVVTVFEGEEGRTPAENLNRIRLRIDSWSWEVPDDLFADCFAEFEPWYRRHYREMDRELVQAVRYELEVWSFDSGD